MTLKELAAALSRLAEVDPYAEVYFEMEATPQPKEALRRVCSLVKRDDSGKVTPKPSKATYVVLG